jgi:hypothetical protein
MLVILVGEFSFSDEDLDRFIHRARRPWAGAGRDLRRGSIEKNLIFDEESGSFVSWFV